MVKSKMMKAPKVPNRETGMARVGTRVARQLCRNTQVIRITSTRVSTRVTTTSFRDSRTYSVLSCTMVSFRSGGKFFSASANTFFTSATDSRALASVFRLMA